MYFGHLVANGISVLVGPAGNDRVFVALCILAPNFSVSFSHMLFVHR
jgi:hypothetical protein